MNLIAELAGEKTAHQAEIREPVLGIEQDQAIAATQSGDRQFADFGRRARVFDRVGAVLGIPRQPERVPGRGQRRLQIGGGQQIAIKPRRTSVDEQRLPLPIGIEKGIGRNRPDQFLEAESRKNWDGTQRSSLSRCRKRRDRRRCGRDLQSKRANLTGNFADRRPVPHHQTYGSPALADRFVPAASSRVTAGVVTAT